MNESYVPGSGQIHKSFPTTEYSSRGHNLIMYFAQKTYLRRILPYFFNETKIFFLLRCSTVRSEGPPIDTSISPSLKHIFRSICSVKYALCSNMHLLKSYSVKLQKSCQQPKLSFPKCFIALQVTSR